MAKSKQLIDRHGRTWTLKKVSWKDAEAEDARFWYEELTPKQRVEAVYEALESSLRHEALMPYPDYEEFIAALNEHGVKYLIVGAHAVAYHGRPRATKDLDVLVDATPENARRILSALEAFLGIKTGYTVKESRDVPD